MSKERKPTCATCKFCLPTVPAPQYVGSYGYCTAALPFWSVDAGRQPLIDKQDFRNRTCAAHQPREITMNNKLYYVYWKKLGSGDTEVMRTEYGFSLPVTQQIAAEMNEQQSALIHWVADVDGNVPEEANT